MVSTSQSRVLSAWSAAASAITGEWSCCTTASVSRSSAPRSPRNARTTSFFGSFCPLRETCRPEARTASAEVTSWSGVTVARSWPRHRPNALRTHAWSCSSKRRARDHSGEHAALRQKKAGCHRSACDPACIPLCTTLCTPLRTPSSASACCSLCSSSGPASASRTQLSTTSGNVAEATPASVPSASTSSSISCDAARQSAGCVLSPNHTPSSLSTLSRADAAAPPPDVAHVRESNTFTAAATAALHAVSSSLTSLATSGMSSLSLCSCNNSSGNFVSIACRSWSSESRPCVTG
eukprot:5022325-Pleurochrysis_carterae.AAC.2